MSEHLFGLSGEDYWKNPWKTSSELVERYVYGREMGIYIDAPDTVDPAAHETIPLLIFYVGMEKDLGQINFTKMAKLVVSDVQRRTVVVNNAVEPSEYGGSTGPFDPKSTAATSESNVTDLAAHGGIRDPGDYLIVVLLWDKLSNPMLIKVGGSARYKDSEVERFIEAKRRELMPPPAPAAPAAGQPVPSYAQIPGSPAIPEQPGLAANIERVALATPGVPCVLQGSFRLPVFLEDRIPPPRPALTEAEKAAGKVQAPEVDYGTPRPTAILPVNLVVTASVDITQKIVQLRVPTWDPLPDGPEPAFATGYFNIDLFADPAFSTTPQTNFIYLFSGEHMSGPHTMAVVTEPMLRIPGR